METAERQNLLLFIHPYSSQLICVGLRFANPTYCTVYYLPEFECLFNFTSVKICVQPWFKNIDTLKLHAPAIFDNAESTDS